MNNSNNELSHIGVLGMKWGTRRGQKKADKLSKAISKKIQAYDRGSSFVNADTFRQLGRKARKQTYKANKRIARMNKYLNSTKGESVNNILVKWKKDPEKVKRVKDYLARNEIQTKKLSELRTSLMDVKLDML